MSGRKPALTLVKASSSSPKIVASTPSGWAARKLLLKSGNSYPDQVKYCSLSAAKATVEDSAMARAVRPAKALRPVIDFRCTVIFVLLFFVVVSGWIAARGAKTAMAKD